MKNVKYFDRINHKLLELEVSDEVARVLWATNRQWSRRGQKDRENIALSLDQQTEYNGDTALTYHELVADENADIEMNLEKVAFIKCVWRVVDKLNPMQATMLKEHYIKKMRASELSEKYHLDRCRFSQHKLTILSHLRTLLCFDEEFTDTKYFKELKHLFERDLEKIAKQKLLQDEYKIDISKVEELTKQPRQIFKIAEKLGVPIDENQKQFWNMAHTEVGNAIKPILENVDKKEFTIEELFGRLLENSIAKPNDRKDKQVIKEVKAESKNLFASLEKFASELADQILDMKDKSAK